ncbi:hypothetical protein [Streptomyces massasporeus]|uniref:hypothetical protein n=1 Tax=Streptomyces massasporeus TaxID=67324 RepID=UPI003F4CE9A8
MPGRTPRRDGRWRDHRQVNDAIAWKCRTGSPWTDLLRPESACRRPDEVVGRGPRERHGRARPGRLRHPRRRHRARHSEVDRLLVRTESWYGDELLVAPRLYVAAAAAGCALAPEGTARAPTLAVPATRNRRPESAVPCS